MQRGFAHLFLILILALVLLAAGIFFYFQIFNEQSSSTNKPSTGISSSEDSQAIVNFISSKPENKEFNNQNFGIAFEYPPEGFSVVEESEEEFNKRGNGTFRKNFTGYVGYPPGEAVGSVVVLDETKNYEDAPLSIWVFSNPDNLTPKDWYRQYWYYPYIWGDFTSRSELIAPIKEATVSGQLGGYNIVDYREGKPQFILVPFKNKMYLFKFPTESKLEVIEEILESFEFLENASKNDEICIQVITPAKNLETEQCKEFPTPCDVPEGWEKVESCNSLL